MCKNCGQGMDLRTLLSHREMMMMISMAGENGDSQECGVYKECSGQSYPHAPTTGKVPGLLGLHLLVEAQSVQDPGSSGFRGGGIQLL